MLILDISPPVELPAEEIVNKPKKEIDLSKSSALYKGEIYSKAAELFNQKPKKGIELLLENKVIQNTPEEIAAFLFNCQELKKEMIGDYLGERENVPILTGFINHLDFIGTDFDIAIRQLLYRFRLPGEAQKIDRIMNSFAARYFSHNKNIFFKHPDTVYVLAFSVIMLNTDAHNPQVKKKMTNKEFLKMNKGINDGQDLPQAFMEDIYLRIVNEEIKMKSDAGKFALTTKKGWAAILKGKEFKRYWFVLCESQLYYFKKLGDTEVIGSIPVSYFKLASDEKNLMIELIQAATSANPVRYKLQVPSKEELSSWLRKLYVHTPHQDDELNI